MHAELQLDNQICFRLYTAARLVTQAYTPMLTALGITYPQYLVLMVLWENDNQPVNDIARRLQIVSLTEEGKTLEEKAFATIPSGMDQQLSACPLKLEDYQHLAEELDSIIDTLKK